VLHGCVHHSPSHTRTLSPQTHSRNLACGRSHTQIICPDLGVQKVFENVTVSRRHTTEFCVREACGLVLAVLACTGTRPRWRARSDITRFRSLQRWVLPHFPHRYHVCVGVWAWMCRCGRVCGCSSRERVHFARVEREGPRHTQQKQLAKCTVDEGRRHVVVLGTSRIDSTYRSHLRAFARHRLSWRSPSTPWSRRPNIENRHECRMCAECPSPLCCCPRSCLHCTVILRLGANVRPAHGSGGHVHVCMAAARMPEAMLMGAWSLWMCCIWVRRNEPCMLPPIPSPPPPHMHRSSFGSASCLGHTDLVLVSSL
jgi:hypothetical protein